MSARYEIVERHPDFGGGFVVHEDRKPVKVRNTRHSAQRFIAKRRRSAGSTDPR